jgi:hypothetical protein
MMIFLCDRADRLNSGLTWTLLYISRFLLVLASFGLVACACVPQTVNLALHDGASGTFFLALLLYFLIGDFLTWRIGHTTKIVSISLTFSSGFLIFLYPIFRYGAGSISVKVRYGISSIASYFAVLLLFVKLIFVKMEMPSHGIRLTRKLICSADEKVE